jgi:hypothetical protein
MARVQVSDETWAAFRAQLGVTPVSVALGRLVQRQVGRAQRQSASDAGGVRLALEDARAVAAELASLIARLERASDAQRSVPHGQPRQERPAPARDTEDWT